MGQKGQGESLSQPSPSIPKQGRGEILEDPRWAPQEGVNALQRGGEGFDQPAVKLCKGFLDSLEVGNLLLPEGAKGSGYRLIHLPLFHLHPVVMEACSGEQKHHHGMGKNQGLENRYTLGEKALTGFQIFGIDANTARQIRFSGLHSIHKRTEFIADLGFLSVQGQKPFLVSRISGLFDIHQRARPLAKLPQPGFSWRGGGPGRARL